MSFIKKLSPGERGVALFTLAYILAFLLYYLSIGNYEFLWYIGVMGFFFLLVLFTLEKSRFDYVILGGLSLWGLLHVAGGGIRAGDKVLYALELIPIARVGGTMVLKFDQLVHFIGFGVATLVVYHLMLPYLDPARVNWKVLFPLIIAGGMGLGALNEIVEFIAVIAFPQTGVGGYFNTGLDLVFNMLGGIAAAVFIKLSGYKQKRTLST